MKPERLSCMKWHSFRAALAQDGCAGVVDAVDFVQ